MKKRGQFYSNLFKYLLIAFVTVMFVFFAIAVINKVKTASCNTKLIMFEKNLKNSVENAYTDVGSIKEANLNVPCDIEEIYFADLDNDMNSLTKSLHEFPLIREPIESNIDKNVFLVKNKKVVNSFYVGDISLQKPYFVCSDTKNGNLNLYLSGKGSSADIANKDCRADCTFEVVEINKSIAEELIQDAIDFGCEGCPKGSLDDEMKNFNRTNQTVRIARRCNCGRRPGQTVVEISIKPTETVKDFKLIEKIPKDFVSNLDDYLESMVGDYDYFQIKEDPLIMWHFDEVSTETIVGYTLDLEIFKYCAEVFKTVGIAVTPKSEGVSSEDELKSSAFVKQIPHLKLEDTAIPPGSTEYHAFKNPVWKYVNSTSLLPSEKRAYNYQISSDQNIWEKSAFSGGINCEIREPDKRIICDTPISFSEAKFYIRFLDSFNVEIGKDSFVIKPFYCGGLEKGTCKSKAGCEWCPKCDGKKRDVYAHGDGSCVNAWEGCSYSCVMGECGAECDSSNACDIQKCDGCYGGIMRLYDVAQCKSDCTCPQCDDPLVSYTEKNTDVDGDTYNIECDGDCDDTNSLINLSSANPYCDCNPTTGGGVTTGTAEICDDNMDNDCDGLQNCEDDDCDSSSYCNGCSATECDHLDGCHGIAKYRDYYDIPNTLQQDGTCTNNPCNKYNEGDFVFEGAKCVVDAVVDTVKATVNKVVNAVKNIFKKVF